jgi:hypothetical protein
VTFAAILEQMIERFNDLLARHGRPPIHTGEVSVCMDDHVDYGKTPRAVQASCVLSPAQFEQQARDSLDKGPSWVHGDFTKTQEGTALITIRFGALVGTPIRV